LTPLRPARLEIVWAMEPPIRTVPVRGVAEGFAVTLERRFDMDLVARVSRQHGILGDQTLSALGPKDCVAKLERGFHLAPLDQIGVGFQEGVDLLGAGDLLSLQHPAAGLTDHALSQLADSGRSPIAGSG